MSLTLIVFLSVRSIHNFIPDDTYYCKEFENNFYNVNNELVAIGNSKLLAAIDKQVLENEMQMSASLLGYAASNLAVSNLTLKSYLNNNKIPPKILLLEVSWFSFNTKRTHMRPLVGDLFIRDFELWTEFLNYYPENAKYLRNGVVLQIQSLVNNNKNYKDFSERFSPSDETKKSYEFSQDRFERYFPVDIAGIDPFLLNEFYNIVEIL